MSILLMISVIEYVRLPYSFMFNSMDDGFGAVPRRTKSNVPVITRLLIDNVPLASMCSIESVNGFVVSKFPFLYVP